MLMRALVPVMVRVEALRGSPALRPPLPGDDHPRPGPSRAPNAAPAPRAAPPATSAVLNKACPAAPCPGPLDASLALISSPGGPFFSIVPGTGTVVGVVATVGLSADGAAGGVMTGAGAMVVCGGVPDFASAAASSMTGASTGADASLRHVARTVLFTHRVWWLTDWRKHDETISGVEFDRLCRRRRGGCDAPCVEGKN